ncbi:hypothetical protein POTOM_032374 [Populus tomentosa]|uniref:CBS domain-containing protein n=1 Tax=Populus tomentosa TaxID=118781 RepID=A0A8X8CSJ4_POPTO|nr:hypothetical protein POTOM_032374 [Populus tomentosa]
MQSVREAGGGVTGTVLMRFVWTHGGRNVFLSGSFNRWSELIPMSPVEGCPNVFQAIYDITPGNHQYKFCVDGEWRHDELQPHSTTEYGIVNIVQFNMEANFNPEMIPGSSMELDNEAFTRLVSVSDGTLTGGVPSISEADLQVSRHRISVFLTTHTAYELLPQSGKVVALDVDLPVKQAFHILFEQGISMAPLWDFSRGQFVGMLSALDFILILRELGNNGSNLTEEELDTHTISAWKEGKAYLERQIDGHAGPYDNLKEVALRILQYKVATVPVIHSSSEDSSFPQLLHLASLSGILKCICRYFRHCSGTLPILQLPIGAIPVGSWVPSIGEPSGCPLVMLRPSASLSSALNLLIQAQVSSIPLVDENDSLVDIYCRSDITALAKDKIYTHINLNEMTINQCKRLDCFIEALQLGQDAYSSHELRSQRCQMCLRSDTLHKVMERLANPGVRRLVIVEAGSKRVEGIVTLNSMYVRSIVPLMYYAGRWGGVKCVLLAHPGGPLRTNKAAALAKFLERKLQDPNGLASIDPDILELAVKNAKDTVLTSLELLGLIGKEQIEIVIWVFVVCIGFDEIGTEEISEIVEIGSVGLFIQRVIMFALEIQSSGGTSKSGTIIHHVTDFGNSEASFEEDKVEKSSPKKRKGKNKKKGKKNKKQKIVDDSECANLKKGKKKLKL